MSLSLATWPAMGRRVNEGINGEVCGIMEKVGILGKMEFWKIGKSFGLERKKRNKRERKKEKNLINEDIFSWAQNETIKNTESRVRIENTENNSENTGIVRNSSISERLANLPKNQ